MTPNQQRYQQQRDQHRLAVVYRAAEMEILASSLTVEQIAQRLGCTKRTVYRYRAHPVYEHYVHLASEQHRPPSPLPADVAQLEEQCVQWLVDNEAARLREAVRRERDEAIARAKPGRYPGWLLALIEQAARGTGSPSFDGPLPTENAGHEDHVGTQLVALGASGADHLDGLAQLDDLDQLEAVRPRDPRARKLIEAQERSVPASLRRPTPKHRLPRQHRYLLYGGIVRLLFEGWDWQRIAEYFDYGVRHVWNIRRRADFNNALHAALSVALDEGLRLEQMPVRVRRAAQGIPMRRRPGQLLRGPTPNTRPEMHRPAEPIAGLQVPRQPEAPIGAPSVSEPPRRTYPPPSPSFREPPPLSVKLPNGGGSLWNVDLHAREDATGHGRMERRQQRRREWAARQRQSAPR